MRLRFNVMSSGQAAACHGVAGDELEMDSGEGTEKGRKAGRWWSRPAIYALFLFCLINLIPCLWGKGILGSFRTSEDRGSLYKACDLAVNDYNRDSKKKRIVLMGSSLVMASVWGADSTRYPGIQDIYHHHRSFFLEDLLKKHGLPPRDVYSLALPGSMISDGYLLAEKLFDGDKVPEVIVYGLAPRDFMDDLLTGETRTAAFQRLMELSDLPGMGDMYLSTWSEKADFVVNNLSFMYGKRWRYQDRISQLVDDLYEYLPTRGCATSANKKPDQELDGQFLLSADRKKVWEKSLVEYGARYKRFNSKQYEKQRQFLEGLLASAGKRGIRVVLVNMPLTADNLELMPDGLYDRYKKTLQALVKRHSCELLDLQRRMALNNDLFYDTVHLNSRGADAAMTEIAGYLAEQKQRAIAVSSQSAY